MIRQAIMAHLKSDERVTSLLGDRIYPIMLPETLDTYPSAAVLTMIISPRHDKAGNAGLSTAGIQVSVWGRRLLESVQASEAVIQALDGYRGQMLSIDVDRLAYVSTTDFFENDVALFHVANRFEITYREV